MKISSEFYDQLSPTYKKLIKELDDKIAAHDATTEPGFYEDFMKFPRKWIEDFADRYLLPKEYWDYYIDECFYSDNPDECYYYSPQRCGKALQHFYVRSTPIIKPGEKKSVILKLLEFQRDEDCLAYDEEYNEHEIDISYPHSNLEEIYFEYLDQIDDVLPNIQLRYERMQKLYEKIKKAENDVEEWFQLLLEVEDFDFVCHNVECRIGKNLLDDTLWKIYIDFLEKFNLMKMFEVYSKYCRFFLDDDEMKEEYISQAKCHKVTVDVIFEPMFEFERRAAPDPEIPMIDNPVYWNTALYKYPLTFSNVKR